MPRGALIFYDTSGKAIARFFGAIPAYLRQSSAAGEFAGLALALDVAPRETSLTVDCKAVAHAWHLPLPKQLAASQVYAGVLLSSYRDPNRPNVQRVQWIKSHRDLGQATSAEEAQEIRRNDEVDALAKAALQCHDDETWEWAKQRAELENTWAVAQTIKATLALWPKLRHVGVRRAESFRRGLIRVPRRNRALPSGSSSEEPGGARSAPGPRPRRVSSAGLPLEFARTRRTTSIMNASSSKRKTLGTSSGELSVAPLPCSTACVAERMQAVVCADWLGSVPVTQCATAARASAAASSKDSNQRQELVLRVKRP